MSAYDAVEPSSALNQDMNFFFDLTTWMKVFSQINKCQQKKNNNNNKNKQTNKQTK